MRESEGNLGLMPKSRIERSPVSAAITSLRRELGITQVEFANTVLHMSWATVAKYETTHPPKGDQLLNLLRIVNELAEVAEGDKARRLLEIGAVFSLEYAREHLGSNPYNDEEKVAAFRDYLRNMGAWLKDIKSQPPMPSEAEGVKAIIDEFTGFWKRMNSLEKEDTLKHSRLVEKHGGTWNDQQHRSLLSWNEEKESTVWPSTNAVKPGGTSSSSVASRSRKARARKAARKR
jgi:hypothetical protein